MGGSSRGVSEGGRGSATAGSGRTGVASSGTLAAAQKSAGAALFRSSFDRRQNAAGQGQRGGGRGSQAFSNSPFPLAPVPSPENIEEIKGVFEPLNLPSGATLLLGNIAGTFTCRDRPYGYYADQDNSCRIFHICYPALFTDGRTETYQYSFMCGERTQFDQKEMTCVHEKEAIPCSSSPEYFYRNSEFGLPEERAQF